VWAGCAVSVRQAGQWRAGDYRLDRHSVPAGFGEAAFVGEGDAAFLIVQDYITVGDDKAAGELEQALRRMVKEAEKAGSVRLVWSTAVTDPRGSSGLKAADERVKATNELILRVAGEAKVPVVRLDTAWRGTTIHQSEGADSRLDSHAAREDCGRGSSGHGGRAVPGAGIRAGAGIRRRCLMRRCDAGVPAAQAAEIKKLVYSWDGADGGSVAGEGRFGDRKFVNRRSQRQQRQEVKEESCPRITKECEIRRRRKR